MWRYYPTPHMLQSQGTEFLQQQLGAATARAEQLAKSVSALELSVEVPSRLVAAFKAGAAHSRCFLMQTQWEIDSYIKSVGVHAETRYADACTGCRA